MSLRERTRAGLGRVEPCLPSPAKAPPSAPGWLHEIKHDGFRILARRDSAGVRLINRAGNDFSSRLRARVLVLKQHATAHELLCVLSMCRRMQCRWGCVAINPARVNSVSEAVAHRVAACAEVARDYRPFVVSLLAREEPQV